MKFKRGDYLLIQSTKHMGQGAIVRYVRKERSGQICAEVWQPSGDATKGMTLYLNPGEVIKTTTRKRTTKRGSFMLLAHCIFSGYKIRATSYWLKQAVPKCPLCKSGTKFIEDTNGIFFEQEVPSTGCGGIELTVEWEGKLS